MNIFVTDESPRQSAQDLDDRRLISAVLETSMLLGTALYIRNIWKPGLYRPTHEFHPCTKWAAESQNNFRWLYHYGVALADEYTFRYGKDHGSRRVIEYAWELFKKRPEVFPKVELTLWANVTPYKQELDVIYAYRRYLLEEKWGPMTCWTKRGKPSWHNLPNKQPTEPNRKVVI